MKSVCPFPPHNGKKIVGLRQLKKKTPLVKLYFSNKKQLKIWLFKVSYNQIQNLAITVRCYSVAYDIYINCFPVLWKPVRETPRDKMS